MNKIDYREFELRNAKLESESVDIYTCPKTEIELYFTAGSERLYAFESFGECEDCHQRFHVSHLHGNISPCEWPIQYLGYYCQECYMKDDSSVALTDEETKILQQDLDDDEE